jgi:hypothetical protein
MLCERIENPSLPERDVVLPWQFMVRDSVKNINER